MSQGQTGSDEDKKEPHYSESIFTPEETTSFLKGFVNAWLKGKIKIQFDGTSEIIAYERERGRVISPVEAEKREIAQYTRIQNQIGIVMGTIASTKDERAKAVMELTSFIINYRANERLTGEFDAFDTEQKLQELTEKVDAIGRAFEAFVKWLRGL